MLIQAFIAFVVGPISIMINGILSDFKVRESTSQQRGWILSWLALGILAGSVSATAHSIIDLDYPGLLPFRSTALQPLGGCRRCSDIE
jgi:hypothetical protein